MPSTTLSTDSWLSALLGRTAFRLDLRSPGEAVADELSEIIVRLDSAPSFATCKVAVDRIATLAALTARGFVLVDTNVSFSKPVDRSACDSRCRLATPSDEDVVASIAASSFIYTRFHLDPWFDLSLAQQIKAQWTRNYFRGTRGDKLIVIEVEGRVTGFAQLLRSNRGEQVIDLIGVHNDYRRQGLGTALCLAAECHADGAVQMLVGTQVANTPSIRLYESIGYRLSHAHYVLHRHHPQPNNYL